MGLKVSAQYAGGGDAAQGAVIALPLPERIAASAEGLPAGLPILGAAGDDGALLAFAAKLHSAFNIATY